MRTELEANMRKTVMAAPKALKKGAKPFKAKKTKKLGNSKSLIGVVTFNDISPL